MLVFLLFALRLVDATIIEPDGTIIQRYDWGNGDQTYVTPQGNYNVYDWGGEPKQPGGDEEDGK